MFDSGDKYCTPYSQLRQNSPFLDFPRRTLIRAVGGALSRASLAFGWWRFTETVTPGMLKGEINKTPVVLHTGQCGSIPSCEDLKTIVNLGLVLFVLYAEYCMYISFLVLAVAVIVQRVVNLSTMLPPVELASTSLRALVTKFPPFSRRQSSEYS
jgi:hypothetical protein